MPVRLHVVLLLFLSLGGMMIAIQAWKQASVGSLSTPAIDRFRQAPEPGAPLGRGVTLVDTDGRPMSLLELSGTVRMIFFGFTHCPDVCPLGLSNMSLLLEELGEEARDVRAVFITVDPERDTPEVMKQFVANFAGGIIGLTGTVQQVGGAVATFHAYAQKVPGRDGAYTVDHTASIFLLDRSGNFRGTIDLHEPQLTAAEKLRRLLRS